MKTCILILTSFVFSCSSWQSNERQQLAEAWKGKNTQELIQHPFFSKLPVTIRKQKWIYEEQDTYRSRANCLALGGCLGIPSQSCQNIFTIKNSKIINYEMKQGCPDNSQKYPLLD